MQILSNYSKNTTAAESKVSDVEVAAKKIDSNDQEIKQQISQKPNIKLSPRAEKFAELNKEFDITGEGFKITNKFINRLEEMKLLTSSQAKNLNTDLKPETKSTNSLSKLNLKIGALVKRVETKTGVESLITILEKSQNILENLDRAKSKIFAIDPSKAAADLDIFIKSDKASILTTEEKDTVKDLRIALTIAGILNPEQQNSAAVGKYMEVLKSL